MTNPQYVELTPEEEQFIQDEPWQGWAVYSSPVTPSALLAKVTNNLNSVPCYVEQQAQDFVEECNALGITSLPD